MKNILLSLLITIICFSCSGQNGISKEEKAQIQEVIENHDKTLIYIWSESCGASKNMFKTNIKPYLEGLEKNNVGIVIIYYGKEEDVADLKSDNRLIISSNLPAAFGKMNANRTMKKLLKDYIKFNGYPIPLLVDKDGVVLNRDEKNNYYDYREIFQAAK
ncbi:MAG: hypothetical protein IJK92_07140 [Bacteroidales bacterium]|nr:hypothetical protein [Bacteroidales bacterium]